MKYINLLLVLYASISSAQIINIGDSGVQIDYNDMSNQATVITPPQSNFYGTYSVKIPDPDALLLTIIGSRDIPSKEACDKSYLMNIKSDSDKTIATDTYRNSALFSMTINITDITLECNELNDKIYDAIKKQEGENFDPKTFKIVGSDCRNDSHHFELQPMPENLSHVLGIPSFKDIQQSGNEESASFDAIDLACDIYDMDMDIGYYATKTQAKLTGNRPVDTATASNIYSELQKHENEYYSAPQDNNYKNLNLVINAFYLADAVDKQGLSQNFKDEDLANIAAFSIEYKTGHLKKDLNTEQLNELFEAADYYKEVVQTESGRVIMNSNPQPNN